MPRDFDAGYPRAFHPLVRTFPGPETYPPDDFRVEWGPIFHRGRLDGTARVLILGQDPAAHETIVRRILVGEAGQRVQGLLAKLGVDHSYVMVNTFLYSVFGQGGGARHKDDPAIAAYRHKWLDKLAATSPLEVVIAFGGLAEAAFQQWRGTPAGQACTAAHVHLTHPTFPESSSASGQTTKAEATEKLLDNWNQNLALISGLVTPDTPRPFVAYGTAFTPADLVAIPKRDLPPGLPEWMRSLDAWASRRPIDEAEGPAATPDEIREAKRAGIGVRVPRKQRAWHTA